MPHDDSDLLGRFGSFAVRPGQSLMQLRRAVTAGRYPPLPSSYSKELSRILAQMIVVDPARRLTPLEIVEHSEVRKRRANRELAHPAAQPEEADDTELLATIKPPKSRYEVKQLSEQLSAMSAQVATARSDKTVEGGGGGGPPERKPFKPMDGLSEDVPAAPVLDMHLPGSRYGGGRKETPGPASKPTPMVTPAYQGLRQAPAAAPSRHEEPPLPPGWKKVPSQSRPGSFSYLNTNTGERVAERPARPASSGGPLPPGWKKVPSQSRPGEFVYMNVNTGERIAWRPTAQDGSRPGQQVPRA